MGRKKDIAIKKPPDVCLNSMKLPSYKCFYIYSYEKLNNKLFFELMKISKNVYNSTLYTTNIFNLFKCSIYKKLYDELTKNKNIICNDFVKKELTFYYDLYTKLKDDIKSNNKYIYSFIVNDIKSKNIIVKNSNYQTVIDNYIFILKNDKNIIKNNVNDDILYYNIIKNIISSIYLRNVNTIKFEMLNHKKFSIDDQELTECIQNGNIIEVYEKNIYKTKIKEEFDKELCSDQNFIERITYLKLGENSKKIDTTMIGSIMCKVHQSFSSYFSLLEKGIRANKPNFIKDIYNLIYTFSKTSKNKNLIGLFTSNYISKNLEKILGGQYIKIGINKYIDNKYLKSIINKVTKKDNFIINDQYIEKTNKHIINSTKIFITIPDKIKDKKIKTIEITRTNGYTKICFNYEIEKIEINKKKIIIKPDESISIDLGMKNLMTIYDPIGEQNIIDGKFISSINKYYSFMIGKAQKIKDDNLINKLQMNRKNIINNYFNLIVKWIINNYKNKKLIIIGYNEEWKQNSNMGKTTNMLFNKIPYLNLINKIKNKLTEENKILVTIEESYTSKCDSLALEEICKHETYLGNRTKRGLYESSKKLMINADLNGAINIMRKVFVNIEKIKGEKICNVRRIKIFREV